jgi:transcription elongation factor Elf1
MAADGEIVELPDCPQCKGKNSVQITGSGFQEHGSQVVTCAHCGASYKVEVHGEIHGEAFTTT